MNVSLLSDLELARGRWPHEPDDALVRRLAEQTIDDLAIEPPIDADIVASFRGIARIESVPLGWAGCLLPEDGEVVARVRSTDPPRRQRFTAFHEIEHTYLPGFGLTQYRCDTGSPANMQPERSQSLEGLADLGASELLLPRRYFAADLDGNDLSMDLVEQLCARYEASLEATALRLVRLAGGHALFVCLEPGVKPSEPSAEPVLRVRWSQGRGEWPYIPRHKSAALNSPFDRALKGEVVDEITTIKDIARVDLRDVQISARLYPYDDVTGTTHLRVLALISAPRLATRAA